jgi:hypothetical protein
MKIKNEINKAKQRNRDRNADGLCGFEVITAVSMKSTVFTNVTPYSLALLSDC